MQKTKTRISYKILAEDILPGDIIGGINVETVRHVANFGVIWNETLIAEPWKEVWVTR